MEKKDVQLDDVFHVPVCYARFFGNNRNPNPNPNPQPNANSKLLVITINVTREKNKDYTVATFPSSIKLQPKKLKQFSNHLQKLFSAGASYKDNPLKISLSGNKPEELKEEIQTFFGLEDVEFKINEKALKVKDDFKVFLIPDDNGVIVSWEQRKGPHNLETDFENYIINDWKTTFTNKSTRKEAKFNISGVSKEVIRNYFSNKYHMAYKQIEERAVELLPEPKSHNEIEFNYPNPIRLVENDFKNSRSGYFYEMSNAILELRQSERDRLSQKVFNDNLTFERLKSKKGCNLWNTIINPRKIFTIDRLVTGHALNCSDSVYVTYRRGKQIRGIITDIDSETGQITAQFLLESGKKPPGYNESAANSTNENSSDYENDDEYEEEEEEDKDDKNDIEKKEYEEFLNNNKALVDNEHEEEEDGDEEKEEKRITECLLKAKDDLLNEDENDELNEEEDFNDEDGPYTIFFQKSDAFYEKCSLALLSLRDSHSDLRRVITDNGYYNDHNKSDKVLSIQEASVDLTESTFLTESERKDPTFLQKLIINPCSEQKKALQMILSNKISIVHGPPGTGKTFSIGLFVYHLLKRMKEGEKNRILLCARNNQAVQNMAKFVSPIVHALGKRMVWVSYQGFENKRQFEEATDEEKTLIDYLIMKRRTKEAEEYQRLQEERWRYNESVQLAKRRHFSNKIPKFPAEKLKLMNEKKKIIEANIIQEADVVCCTIPGSAKYTVLHNIFGTIFIDEAQEPNEIYSIIPLIHQPEKLILLGDSKQLEAYANPKMKQKYKTPFTSLYKKLMTKKVPSQLLTTQYRMHPLILKFPNDEFYPKINIQTASTVEKDPYDLTFIRTPIVFVNVPNGREKMRKDRTYINNHECYIIQKIVSNLKISLIKGRDVGILTPYFSQAQKLKRILSPLNYKNLKVSTIESFQGDERDFIILSLVRTMDHLGEIEFLPKKNPLNVALTRARKGLIIVGKFKTFSNERINANLNLLNLCNYCSLNDLVVDGDSIELLKHLVVKPKKKKPLLIQTKPKKDENNNNDVFADDASADRKVGGDVDDIDKFIEGENDGDDNDDDIIEYDDYDDQDLDNDDDNRIYIDDDDDY